MHASPSPDVDIAGPVVVFLPLHHTLSPVTAQDLDDLAACLPGVAEEIVRALGVTTALALFNGLGGAQIWIPKGPCNNPAGARTWAYLARIVGDAAMLDLARHYGGERLDVPMLVELRTQRRNRAIVRHFDAMTASPPKGAGLSKARAVQELGVLFLLSYRQVELIIDAPGGVV